MLKKKKKKKGRRINKFTGNEDQHHQHWHPKFQQGTKTQQTKQPNIDSSSGQQKDTEFKL